MSKKLAITGGIGAKPWGYGEAFGRNYELPNIKAYNETCASIGNVFWNHRLFLLYGDAKYIDLLERILYNGLISGVSLDGNTFFYNNPLASKGYHNRNFWFECPCCPTNVARFLADLPSYIYAQQNNKVFVNLFLGSTATFLLGDKEVSITQETDYPWKGYVKITINLKERDDFTIAIRIPGWTQNQPVPSSLYHYLNEHDGAVDIKVNGQSVETVKENGYATIDRTWKDSDTIEFDMPMLIRRVIAHENVKNLKGRVALERGPVVYCVEWVDNNVDRVFNLFLEDDAELKSEYHEDMLNGIAVITGNIHYLQKSNEHISKDETEFLAIPYYAWAHRGKGDMTIWMLRDLKDYGKSLG